MDRKTIEQGPTAMRVHRPLDFPLLFTQPGRRDALDTTIDKVVQVHCPFLLPYPLSVIR